MIDSFIINTIKYIINIMLKTIIRLSFFIVIIDKLYKIYI